MENALPAIAVAILGALGIVLSARYTAKGATQSSMDTRAQGVLDQALAWQGAEIIELRTETSSLRGRVHELESEVAACETGRAADRERFDADMADLRRQILQIRRGQ